MMATLRMEVRAGMGQGWQARGKPRTHPADQRHPLLVHVRAMLGVPRLLGFRRMDQRSIVKSRVYVSMHSGVWLVLRGAPSCFPRGWCRLRRSRTPERILMLAPGDDVRSSGGWTRDR